MRSGYATVAYLGRSPLRLHWTLPIGALVVSGGHFAPYTWAAFAFLILVHELGHAFLVRRYRHAVVSIDLHGLGGHCRWSGYASEVEKSKIAWGGVLATGHRARSFRPPRQSVSHLGYGARRRSDANAPGRQFRDHRIEPLADPVSRRPSSLAALSVGERGRLRAVGRGAAPFALLAGQTPPPVPARQTCALDQLAPGLDELIGQRGSTGRRPVDMRGLFSVSARLERTGPRTSR